MMLGLAHGWVTHGRAARQPGDVISVAKFVDLLPVGTVIRNGCDSRAPAGEGVHLKKMATQMHHSGTEWVGYYPKTGAINASGCWPIQAGDLYLPIQIVSIP